MAPPHAISPPKNPRPRPEPVTKPTKHRSMVQARLTMNSYSQPSQPIMPTVATIPEVEDTVIEQFRLRREKGSNNLEADLPENLT